jgi:hypothetical protein
MDTGANGVLPDAGVTTAVRAGLRRLHAQVAVERLSGDQANENCGELLRGPLSEHSPLRLQGG